MRILLIVVVVVVALWVLSWAVATLFGSRIFTVLNRSAQRANARSARRSQARLPPEVPPPPGDHAP